VRETDGRVGRLALCRRGDHGEGNRSSRVFIFFFFFFPILFLSVWNVRVPFLHSS
jgi:hypothetical protein